MTITLTNKPYNNQINNKLVSPIHNLFDLIYSDHILEGDDAVGKELLGMYIYKNAIAGGQAGYPEFYEKCVAEKSSGTPTPLTVGNTTITLYVNSNGHKFYDIANKDIIDEIYESTGEAYYFGIDTENERVFLPRQDIALITPKTQIKIRGNGNGLGLDFGDGKIYYPATYSGYGTAHVLDAYTYSSGIPSIGAAPTGGWTEVPTAKIAGITSDPDKSGLITDILHADQNKYVYMVVGNTSTVTNLTTNIADSEVLQQINTNSADITEIKDNIQQTPHITRAYANGTSRYRKWSNGTLEQWFTVTSETNMNKSTEHVLLVDYANENYDVYVNAKEDENAKSACVISKTTSFLKVEAFRGTTSNSGYNTLSVYAIGQV